MELILKIVSFHRLSPEQKSEINVSSSLTLGRSEDNDWHLPDPEKIVSGLHARIEKKTDSFYIYDLSTNGLFINRAVEALGKSASHKLSQGDLLSFGDYEIQVKLITDPKATDPMTQRPAVAQAAVNVVAGVNTAQGISAHSILNDTLSSSVKQKQMPLVSNDLNDHFDVPQPIPQEWNSVHDEVNSNNSITHDDTSIIEDTRLPDTSFSAHLNHPNESTPLTVKNDKPQMPSSIHNASFESFFKGLGVSQSLFPDQISDELLYEMGESMQQLLMGLMTSLRTRTALKNKFRINQTTFQQQENNPLKFSATMDDAFQNLFLKKSSSFLSASKAITEAFDDTQKHDIALSAGTIGAIQGVFNQLAPSEIEKKCLKESVLDQVIPGQKQSRFWRIYQSLHKDMVEEVNTQNSSLLSDDFAKAYDKKIQSL